MIDTTRALNEKIILDNECSGELKAALKKHDKKYEHTPLHVHQCNAVEPAIRTFKNHFCPDWQPAAESFHLQNGTGY